MELNSNTVFTLISLALIGMIIVSSCAIIQLSFKTILFWRALRLRGQKTTGRVISIRGTPADFDTSATYYPTFTYQIESQTYQFEADGMALREFKVGQEIELQFLPEKPEDCTWRKTEIHAIVGLLFGFTLLILSILSFSNAISLLVAK